MKKNHYPKGWNEERVQSVLKAHENQSEDEAVAEIEEMFARRGETVMTVPRKLVPEIRKLIARHASKSRIIGPSKRRKLATRA